MHTTDGGKIHQNAVAHLMELWPGASSKLCGKLLITIERQLERQKLLQAGSTPMSASCRDMGAINFQALQAGAPNHALCGAPGRYAVPADRTPGPRGKAPKSAVRSCASVWTVMQRVSLFNFLVCGSSWTTSSTPRQTLVSVLGEHIAKYRIGVLWTLTVHTSRLLRKT